MTTTSPAEGTAAVVAGQEFALLQAIGQVASGGLAVLDERHRVRWLNPTAAEMFGEAASTLLDRPWPWQLTTIEDGNPGRPEGVPDDASVSLDGPGGRRLLQYRAAWVDLGGARRVVVSITDVTQARRQQRRLAAVARAASSVADAGRLSATLDALARAVFESTGLAAVQILTLHGEERELRMMGEAGFFDVENFSEKLAECRRRGAELKMLEAAVRCAPIVVLHRKPDIMRGPRLGAVARDHGRGRLGQFRQHAAVGT